MTFPLEKILTISAREYAEINRKALSDYDAIGVQSIGNPYCGSIHEHFAKSVPANAEIVVGYRTNHLYL